MKTHAAYDSPKGLQDDLSNFPAKKALQHLLASLFEEGKAVWHVAAVDRGSRFVKDLVAASLDNLAS